MTMESGGSGLERTESVSDESALCSKTSGNTVETPTPEVQVRRRKCFIYLITIEPLVFAVFLAESLNDSVTANFILKRTCENHFHFNASTCDELVESSKNKSNVESIVQPYSAALLTGMNFLSILLPAITSLFLGPWSDYNGRKLLLISPAVGYILKYIILGLFTIFPKLGPEYALVGVIPVALSGGSVNFISAAYSYVSDISEEEKRFFRITMVEISLGVGIYIGLLILSNAFQGVIAHNYIIIYGISALTVLVVAIPTCLLLPESVQNIERGKGIWNVFELKLFKEMLNTCFRRREGGKRLLIFLLIASLTLTLSVESGLSNVLYLFTRLKFGWNIRDYTFWWSITLAIYFLGSFLGVTLLWKWLKLPEDILGLLSYTSHIVLFLYIAFVPANSPNLMFYGGLINIFGSLCGPIGRALLSKTVPKEDLGKLFALTSSSESFFPLIIGPLYTVLYNSTLNTLPSAFLLLSGSLFGLCWIFFLIIYFVQKKHSQMEYNSIENTSDSG